MDNEKCLKPATRMSFEPLWSDLRSLWSPFPCHIGFDGEDWGFSQNKYGDIMGNHSVYTGTIWFIVTEGNSWPETMFFPRRCISVSCKLSHHPILGNWHPTWQSTPWFAFGCYIRTISVPGTPMLETYAPESPSHLLALQSSRALLQRANLLAKWFGNRL